MARYLVAHNVVSIYEDQEDWIRDWSGLRQRAKADARWTSSWYCSETNRMYCEWDAPNREVVEQIFRELGIPWSLLIEVEVTTGSRWRHWTV